MNKITNNKSLWFNLIIFTAILVFVNLVSVRFFTRFDFSKGKIYSLSKASKNVSKNLKDRIVVKAYFSKNLPGEFADAARYTRDLLSEYAAFSHGKFRFEFIDPGDEEELKQEAQKNRILPVSMRVAEKDKIEIREVYMGLAFLYRDKKEIIPLIQNTRGLEYDITSTIKKITSFGLKKIAIFELDAQDEFGYPGQINQADKFKTIRQLLQKNYEVISSDLTEPLATGVEALLFTGVEDSLTQDQLYNLDQYIMHGGNTIFFQDRITADLQTLKASAIKSNIFDLLANYGIHLKTNLVMDASCGQIQVQRRQQMFTINTPIAYPFFPLLRQGLKSNMIVKNLENITMVFASEIDTARVRLDHEFEPLLASSKNSSQVRVPQLDISYQDYLRQDLTKMFNEGPKVMAGIFTGRFKSFFPADNAGAGYLPETDNARVLMVADADFIKETAGGSMPNNIHFVMNAVDYMVSDDALISIRARETEYHPLKELDPTARSIVKWINILLPSLLLLAFGFINNRKQKAKRKMVRELYE